MNIILFEASEVSSPLSKADSRAVHVLEVLRRREGDSFDAGVVNGPRGKAVVRHIAAGHLELEFRWGDPLPPLSPLTLIVGLPRPQTARKILNEAATFGVTALHFVATGRSDPNYAASTLWSSGEWRRHLLAGAAQAFDTRIPEVTWTRTLSSVAMACGRAAQDAPAADSNSTDAAPELIALDNYEANLRLGKIDLTIPRSVCLALGPERGWDGDDRDVLRSSGFQLVHLGQRVLRTETALVAALGILSAKQGHM